MIYDCFSYWDEDLLLDLRLNILDDYVDFFVVVEGNKTWQNNSKKLIFDIKKFKNFKEKIIYIPVTDLPDGIDPYLRENYQRNCIVRGLKTARDEDLIIISDLDEIPNLKNINLSEIKNEVLIFRQDMFYYKFNLKLPNYKWTGSKACKMKILKNPQWLRNIKDKKFGFYRIDTFFSNTKYRNLKIVEDGGWHYTNIKTAKEIEYKLRSYLHHHEFDINPLSLEQIENIIKDRKAIYNLELDQRQNKFGNGPPLIKIELGEIPDYLKNNPDIFNYIFNLL